MGMDEVVPSATLLAPDASFLPGIASLRVAILFDDPHNPATEDKGKGLQYILINYYVSFTQGEKYLQMYSRQPLFMSLSLYNY